MGLFALSEMESLVRAQLNAPTEGILSSAEIRKALNDGYKDVSRLAGCIENYDVVSTVSGDRFIPYDAHRVNFVYYGNPYWVGGGVGVDMGGVEPGGGGNANEGGWVGGGDDSADWVDEGGVGGTPITQAAGYWRWQCVGMGSNNIYLTVKNGTNTSVVYARYNISQGQWFSLATETFPKYIDGKTVSISSDVRDRILSINEYTAFLTHVNITGGNGAASYYVKVMRNSDGEILSSGIVGDYSGFSRNALPMAIYAGGTIVCSYFSNYNDYVARSTDYGATWNSVLIGPVNTGGVLAGNGAIYDLTGWPFDKVYKSVDMGGSWTLFDTTGFSVANQAPATTDGVYWISTPSYQVYKLYKMGATEVEEIGQITGPDNYYSYGMRGCLYNGNYSFVLYASILSVRYLYKSNNNQIFSPIQNLSSYYIPSPTTFTMGSSGSKAVFAAGRMRSGVAYSPLLVLYSADGGSSWQAIQTPFLADI